ncbi:hypothetical protein [Kosakonia cowanii]|uniref:hypothetical protein n=1 Tax=Kosakonia cowanii TaxID=208223 RepID=UPI0025A942B4|nr:hypothetical protein [Kosakonia cowanii]MDM9617436.1 hypothetical protein [Kosakonia cowanii]MDP4562678.1 hypothetical protein [Kosakonia cowanii]
MNRYAVHTLMLVTLALFVSLVLMVSATKSEAAQTDYITPLQCSFCSLNSSEGYFSS